MKKKSTYYLLVSSDYASIQISWCILRWRPFGSTLGVQNHTSEGSLDFRKGNAQSCMFGSEDHQGPWIILNVVVRSSIPPCFLELLDDYDSKRMLDPWLGASSFFWRVAWGKRGGCLYNTVNTWTFQRVPNGYYWKVLVLIYIYIYTPI